MRKNNFKCLLTENRLKIPIYASSQISTTLDEFSKSK